MTEDSSPGAGLGTLLRHLVDVLDGDVAQAYAEQGLADYRPRFTPVVRALERLGPSTIGAIAEATGVSHSAVSQTVSEMVRRGLVSSTPGADARRRVIGATPELDAILPALKRQWEATTRAEAALNAGLPYSLRQAVTQAIGALEQKSFLQLIHEQVGAAADAD